MKLKLIGCMFVGVMLSMVLASCGDQEVKTFEKKGVFNLTDTSKTELNWIGHWLNEHDREAMVREVAKEFAVKNPNIDLNLKFPQMSLGCTVS